MEEEAIETHYWCHACSDFVNPLIDGDILTCILCQTGFVEEVIPAPPLPLTTDHHDHDDDDDESNDGETDLDQRVEDFISTRRGNAAAILALLQEIRAGLPAESESNDGYRSSQELAVLIVSFNERLRIQDSLRSGGGGGGASSSVVPSGSLGDYFIGSGFDSLIERLAENDPNDRYGTPPATKEALESLATVKVVPEESLLLLLQCTVCLDGFEIGIEAKEMPCKHVFHRECLLPWLELHSSCPVCRYLLPRNDDDDDDDDDGESKNDAEETSRNDDDNSVASMEGNDGSSLESRSMNRGEF